MLRDLHREALSERRGLLAKGLLPLLLTKQALQLERACLKAEALRLKLSDFGSLLHGLGIAPFRLDAAARRW